MFNPAKASNNIKEEFIDYILTAHSFADQKLQQQLRTELEAEISRGPILEIKDIFKEGSSIRELVEQGVLSKLFLDLESKKPDNKLYAKKLPLDRKLYLHQEKAIKTIAFGNNAVVSTGTGSGKTNCFLIPVLNELLREKEAGTLGDGVRALFIYPMNALANDQMKNIREILMFYPEITFGSYNGGTENEEEKAIAVYEAMFANEKTEELRHRLDNEILSRDEMKKRPPNILFTNYAMLEHLLFRPKDDILFSNADFKFVVLDEAHVYNGATGIETAILLRRLRARISASKQTQFILTSATLGNDSTVDNDIVTFAQNLCGVEFDESNIIRATREIYVPKYKTTRYPSDLFVKLADEQNIVAEVLEEYGLSVDRSKTAEELLYDLLIDSELYNRLRREVNDLCDLTQLGSILGENTETIVAFISLCTKAQKKGKLLVDARYHYFIRALEGCYLTLNPKRKLFLNRQKFYFSDKKQNAVFEAAICDDCGRIALVGKIENKKFLQSSKLEEDVDFFYLENDENTELDDEDEEIIVPKKKNIFYLCPDCGAVAAENEIHIAPCECGQEKYIRIIKAHKTATGAKCGNCRTGHYKRLYLGNDAATAVLATALYEELPELIYEETTETNVTNNIFAKVVLKSRKQPKRTGRQFLVFSDSRQEAAKFACYLEKSYNEFLRRRGIWQIVNTRRDEIISSNYTISDFVTLLTSYFTAKKSFGKSNNDESNLTINSRKNAWIAMLNELARYSSATSLTALGQIQFEYLGNTQEIVNAVSEEYAVPSKNVKALLDLLIFEIVKMGAVYTDSDSDIDDNDREYIFYTPSQRFVTYLQAPDKKRNTVQNWAPRNKIGKTNEFYRSNRLYFTCKTLGIDEVKGADFLRQYFDYLTKPEYGNTYCLLDLNKDGTFVIPAKYFSVKINGSKGASWYRCKKCGRITQFDLSGYCPVVRCGGKIEKIDPDKIVEENHFAKLYAGERMSPLFIKEHTAQLSKKESAEYQEQFIKKEINALSCSTTFEMGVDVGDLETVFLRDVPPLPSNYAQRAGRAGRSINAAAFALTYAKLSSHDLSFFKEPQQMIRGMILPPLFKVDNEKIVRRHVYAVALSMFFSENEKLYNHNDAEKFINEKGYEQFLKWIKNKPEKLKEILKKSIPNIDNLHDRIGINDFSWIEMLCGEEGVFTQLITEYETNIDNFNKLIARFKKDDLKEAARQEAKLYHYKSNKLIDFLARGNILPRYGFPVDTVELYQNSSAQNISKLRLSRDLQVAIAEYAPSSEVVAGGRLYTSRYIKQSALGTNRRNWHTAYIGECDNPRCKTINYSLTAVSREGIECTSCKKRLLARNFFESIEPRAGFVAERKDKDVPLTKQDKNYKSEDYYIGNTVAKTIDKYYFSYNGIKVQVESTTNDSLMVKSTNNFYVCSTCGYSIAEDESIGEKDVEKQIKRDKALSVETSNAHESLFGQYLCNNKKLERRTLHHVFNTDVAKISFDCNTSDYNTMVSVMYAILNAMAKYLNIERRDIKGCLSQKVFNGVISYSIIIYDSVPGGAGHSRRLVTKDGKMLYDILMSALNNMVKCDCDPSCYRCLRSYENQKIHDILDRQAAAKFLSDFRGDIQLIKS